MDLRRWLAKHKPQIVRVTLSDGTVKAIAVPVHGKPWASVVQTIGTYADAAKVEACDGKENVHAAVDLEREESEVEAEEKKHSSEVRAIADAIPLMARYFNEGADAAAARIVEAYTTTFQMQVDLLKLSYERLFGLEKMYYKLLFDKAAEAAGGGPADADGMVAAFLAQAMKKKIDDATGAVVGNGANGAAETKKPEGKGK